MARHLIIGNSAGGVGAAEAIREVDKESSLVIVSDEPYPAYSRPLISEFLAGERYLDGMLFRPPDFYRENEIDLILGKKVTSLDLQEHLARLDDGEEIPWERLLLATGGLPIVPRMEGLEKEGVFSFITLDDAKGIRKALEGTQRVVVIGGGLIGISATEALLRCGVEVVVVEMRDRILNTILDEEASGLADAALRQMGVEIVVGHTIREIVGQSAKKGSVCGVVLDDGKEVACDLVVVAIGVIPRTELVRDTAIEVNRGIVVDRRMGTSWPQVYACGDVAEAYDFVHAANRVNAVWPSAYVGGRIAGFNMVGVETEYSGGVSMNSLKCAGLAIIAAGLVNLADDPAYEVLSRRENGTYQKIVLKDERVVGMIFAGRIEKSGIVFGLMRDGVGVADFKDALLEDDFGFISLPERLRLERLETMQHGNYGKV